MDYQSVMTSRRDKAAPAPAPIGDPPATKAPASPARKPRKRAGGK